MADGLPARVYEQRCDADGHIGEHEERGGTILNQKTLSWGEGRMLTGIYEDANNYVTYTYNQDGLRTRKTACNNGTLTTTDYIWDDGLLIAEKAGSETITILYNEDGEAEGFVVEYEQDGCTPWGNPAVDGDENIAAINLCSYRGYYFDGEIGWYYLQSRYYNPETGRFLNADDAEMIRSCSIGENLFVYCANNHICCNDSDGFVAARVIGGGLYRTLLNIYGIRFWIMYRRKKSKN